jgi:NAD(P)-dependent dehydrogenase (short-subunit alcohol dehydrogenase family)
VNAVAPGYITTAMTAGRLADPDFRERVEARIPFGGVGVPDDVVGPIVFLLSDASRYVTGAVLPVDGGFFLGA